MKAIIALSILFSIMTGTTDSYAGTMEIANISEASLVKSDFTSKKVGVQVSEDGKVLTVAVLNDADSLGGMHSVLDLSRMDEFKYKLRVIRYFGGLLKEQVYGITKMIVKTDGRVIETAFTRKNVSDVVKLFY